MGITLTGPVLLLIFHNAVFADILRWLCALLLKRVGRDFVDGFRILMEGNCEEAEKGKEI